MSQLATAMLVLLLAALLFLLGCAVLHYTYCLGFMDGVLWQRDWDEGKVYPDRPRPRWPGWEDLDKDKLRRQKP